MANPGSLKTTADFADESESGIDQVFGHEIAFEVASNLSLMVGEVAEGVEDLGQRQMRQMRGDVLRGRCPFGTSPPHISALARTGVRVPLMIGSPPRMAGSFSM
jgi:hypothetical protein